MSSKSKDTKTAGKKPVENAPVPTVDAVVETAQVDHEAVIAAKDAEIATLQSQVKELEDKLKNASPNAAKESKPSGNRPKVKVHHGVQVGQKVYSKSDIEKNGEIQEYLLSIGSSAVSEVE